MNKTQFSAKGSQLTVTRTFDAPIDLVWRAWTEAELLDQWWAPSPWKSKTKTMDFSENGKRLYAMCGPGFDPDCTLALPSAQIAVMGGSQAAKTLLQIQVSSLKKKGQEIDPEVKEKLLTEITDRYNKQTSPYYAAARLWVDGIINPVHTRKIISTGIEAANLNPDVKPFNPGVIQT